MDIVERSLQAASIHVAVIAEYGPDQTVGARDVRLYVILQSSLGGLRGGGGIHGMRHTVNGTNSSSGAPFDLPTECRSGRFRSSFFQMHY